MEDMRRATTQVMKPDSSGASDDKHQDNAGGEPSAFLSLNEEKKRSFRAGLRPEMTFQAREEWAQRLLDVQNGSESAQSGNR